MFRVRLPLALGALLCACAGPLPAQRLTVYSAYGQPMPSAAMRTAALSMLPLNGSQTALSFPATAPSFYANVFPADGAGKELDRGVSFFTLARVLLVNRTTNELSASERQNIRKRFFIAARALIGDPNHMPDLDAGLAARPQYSGLAGLAVGMNFLKTDNAALPYVDAAEAAYEFTPAERGKIVSLGRAALASAAWSYMDYVTVDQDRTTTSNGGTLGNRTGSKQRISMDLDVNTYVGSNYAEGIMGLFFAGLLITKDAGDTGNLSGLHGGATIQAFLSSYNHATFLNELDAKGLGNVATAFRRFKDDNDQLLLPSVYVSGVTYKIYNLTNKGAAVNAALKGIADADTAGNPFFRGLRLGEIESAPVRAAVLLEDANLRQPDTLATEGEFSGGPLSQGGRFQEFNAANAQYASATSVSTKRDSLLYANLSFSNLLITRCLLTVSGRWTDAADIPVVTANSTRGGNERTAAILNGLGETAALDQWEKVGLRDLHPKGQHGYWDIQKGEPGYYLSASTEYKLSEDYAVSLGLMRRVFFSDAFEARINGNGDYIQPFFNGGGLYADTTDTQWRAARGAAWASAPWDGSNNGFNANNEPTWNGSLTARNTTVTYNGTSTPIVAPNPVIVSPPDSPALLAAPAATDAADARIGVFLKTGDFATGTFSAGIAARYRRNGDLHTYYTARLRQTAVNRTVTSSTLEIARVNDNVLTVLQTASFTWAPNEIYQLQFALQGNALTARATGQLGTGAVAVACTDTSAGAFTGTGLAGLVSTAVATRFDNFFVTDNTVPADPGASFVTWKFQNFGCAYADDPVAGDNADPDRDGLPNLAEYALAGSPNANTQANLPQVGLVNDAAQLTFTRRAPSEAAYSVQASDDLAAWTDVAFLPSGGGTWSGPATVSETGGGSTRAVIVHDPVNATGRPRLFLRLLLKVP